MLKFAELTQGAIDQFVPRREMMHLPWRELMESNKERPLSAAVIGPEGVYALVVATELWPGVMEVSSVVGELAHQRPISFHRLIAHALQRLERAGKLNRIQMTVRVGFREAEDWAESLGFKHEGILKKYGPEGADYWMYARFPCGR